jgi:hypothetical protein
MAGNRTPGRQRHRRALLQRAIRTTTVYSVTLHWPSNGIAAHWEPLQIFVMYFIFLLNPYAPKYSNIMFLVLCIGSLILPKIFKPSILNFLIYSLLSCLPSAYLERRGGRAGGPGSGISSRLLLRRSFSFAAAGEFLFTAALAAA